MANVTCPVCGYEAEGSGQIMGHMKNMADDQHKAALKQKMGEKGGEAKEAVEEKVKDVKGKVGM